MYDCKFCSSNRPSKKSLVHHQRTCVKNPDRKMHTRTNQFVKAKQLGLPRPVGKKTNGWLGRKHSEETKSLLRKRQQDYLQANPHMSPWVHSHYSKRKSYAQMYWENLLTERGVNFQDECILSKYRLDIYIESAKFNLEIDGEQHYIDGKLRPSDVRRDEYTRSQGIITRRIRWSQYKKMSLTEKEKCVNDVLELINGSVTRVAKGQDS